MAQCLDYIVRSFGSLAPPTLNPTDLFLSRPNLGGFPPLADQAKGGDGAKSALREICL
jgi:hypothetical protein